MESVISAYRLMHFLGLGLFFGGLISSMILIKKQETEISVVRSAWYLMHLTAAPGLVLLIASGLLQSSASAWAHFKGTGYMHAKVFLVVILLLALAADLKKQKNILKQNLKIHELKAQLQKRQRLAAGMSLITLAVMALVSLKPF